MDAESDFEAVIVLSTIAADVDAGPLARILVEEKLAACVSLLPPMTSTYTWQGRVEQEREQQLIIKTVTSRVAALEARLHQLHPYAVPEFLVIPVVSGSAAYLGWLRESTRE